jgi:hypothetical protein
MAVAPSKKVTVPVGFGPLLRVVTFAVSVIGWPAKEGLPGVVSVICVAN